MNPKLTLVISFPVSYRNQHEYIMSWRLGFYFLVSLMFRQLCFLIRSWFLKKDFFFLKSESRWLWFTWRGVRNETQVFCESRGYPWPLSYLSSPHKPFRFRIFWGTHWRLNLQNCHVAECFACARPSMPLCQSLSDGVASLLQWMYTRLQ